MHGWVVWICTPRKFRAFARKTAKPRQCQKLVRVCTHYMYRGSAAVAPRPMLTRMAFIKSKAVLPSSCANTAQPAKRKRRAKKVFVQFSFGNWEKVVRWHVAGSREGRTRACEGPDRDVSTFEFDLGTERKGHRINHTRPGEASRPK